MASETSSDALALYYELVLEGQRPNIDEFCARYPGEADLRERIRGIDALREDLDQLFAKPASSGSIVPPDLIGGVRIQREIGSGGMGQVYLGVDVATGMSCAIKLMRIESHAQEERFRREIRLAQRLDHENVARVTAGGIEDDVAYVVSELVHGFSLRALLRCINTASYHDMAEWIVDALRRVAPATPLHERAMRVGGYRTVVDIACQIASALGQAHRSGVVHRDVKPDNIMLTFHGTVKLIDFGLAISTMQEDTRVTRTGAFLGSVSYAAPEQLRGHIDDVGPWTDTFALGATLFELLTRRPPFEAKDIAERLQSVDAMREHAPSFYNPTVPSALDQIVLRALDPDPHERFQDGMQLARELRARPTIPQENLENSDRLDQDHGTVVGFPPRIGSRPDLRSALEANWVELRARHAQVPVGSYLILASRCGEPIATSALLMPVSDTSATVIVGRHSHAQLRLSDDPSVALRHLIARLLPEQQGGGIQVRDLKTGQGFHLHGFGQAESVISDGPLFLRIGHHDLLFLPGSHEPWPDTPDAGAELLSRQSMEDQRASPIGSLKRKPFDRSATSVTIVRGVSGLSDRCVHGNVVGRLTVEGVHRRMELDVTDDQLDRGLLLGRYQRCDVESGIFWDDDRVSRVHMLLLRDIDRVLAIDTASTNGTRVNGANVAICALDCRAKLELGGGNEIVWVSTQ